MQIKKNTCKYYKNYENATLKRCIFKSLDRSGSCCVLSPNGSAWHFRLLHIYMYVQYKHSMLRLCRQYEREQRCLLAELQSKARREKNDMITALLEAADRGPSSGSEVDKGPDTAVRWQGSTTHVCYWVFWLLNIQCANISAVVTTLHCLTFTRYKCKSILAVL